MRLPGLPKALDGFTIVQLTDIHIGTLHPARFLDELVARANALKPDLVAITGDLVDGTVAQLGAHRRAAGATCARARHLLRHRQPRLLLGRRRVGARAARASGCNVLRNRRVEIGDAGARSTWSAWTTGALGTGDYDLDAALARARSASARSVLLAHQPPNFDEVAERGVGLQLSGHTHGGQMFPGTRSAQLIWGDRNAGLSRHGERAHLRQPGLRLRGAAPMRVGVRRRS